MPYLGNKRKITEIICYNSTDIPHTSDGAFHILAEIPRFHKICTLIIHKRARLLILRYILLCLLRSSREHGNYDSIAMPGTLALIAAAVSIVVKEGMFWYTRAAAKKIDSSALRADAWHHRSDALSSIGSFAGILGARLGVPVLDPVASVVICLFIFKAAADIFADAVRKMTDEACDPQTEARIAALISSTEGVEHIDKLRTRKFGDRIYVEAEISVCGDISLRDAHAVAQCVHTGIEKGCPQVKHISVHVNPTDHVDTEEEES